MKPAKIIKALLCYLLLPVLGMGSFLSTAAQPENSTPGKPLRHAKANEAAAGAGPLDKIKLPPGFHIAYYAKVPGARSMALGADGIVYVGTFKGSVYGVRDLDGDHYAEQVVTIAQGLNRPNGVAYRDGALYVAEISRILKFDLIDDLEAVHEMEVINDTFPSNRHHGWKYIAFGPDGMLYVPVGAPCNICNRPGYAAIYRLNPDGSGKTLFASGVRNTVGMAWHPVTKALWFTDNGRDLLGDDTPPDELNHASGKGLHFGYPYCHGNNISDPRFGQGKNCWNYVQPVQALQPHTAALGLTFYEGGLFPPEYKHSIFIAEHGSWNRTTPVGYRLTRVRLDGDRAVSYDVFAEGWLQPDGAKLGRPVDVLVLPDGALLVSDDKAGVIYRISYVHR